MAVQSYSRSFKITSITELPLEKRHRIGFVMVWHCIRVRLAWEWLEIPLRHQYKSNQEPKLDQSNPVPLLYQAEDHIVANLKGATIEMNRMAISFTNENA